MDPELIKIFNVQQNSDTEVTIHIYGIIGVDETWWNEGTNNVAFAIVSMIRELETQYEKINIRINSPGGFIDDGLAIYNSIKFSKAKTHTYNDGIVASMAGTIYMAGQVKHAPKTAIHHIHSASSITIGNIKDHQETIKTLETYEETLAIAYSEPLKKTKEEIKSMWFDGEEHYYTGEEAYNLGLVDVLEETKVNIPSNITNMSYKQLLNLYENDKGTQQKKQDPQKKKQSLINKVEKGLKKVLGTAISDNSKTNKKFENMRDLPLLIALFAIDYINVDDQGKAVLDRAQAQKVEAELNRLSQSEQKVIDLSAEKLNLEKDLKTAIDSIASKDKEIEDLTASVTAKDLEIADLKAKLDNKPADDSTKITDKNKGGENDGVDWKTINNLSHNKEADDCA